MKTNRTEHDLLGECELPADALYGIQTRRAAENFPLSRRAVHPALIHAYGAVKLACARANRELGVWETAKAEAIESACRELFEGTLDRWIIVDALQGGAGTSTNMNVNEVIANRALELLGIRHGDYSAVSPLEDINLHQSTNDTYPTALKVASIGMLHELEGELVGLLEAFQAKERELAHVVKVGRTELQDAVLTTLGREMSAYAEAFARDRWRIYKCEERLRVVNLGGTAIGTGLTAPRSFIFRATEHLREIVRSGLVRAENLVECTQNADVFVEVSGMLKACAASMIKVASDLRFLSSGPQAGIGEIHLPARQAGSTIMPTKVNPVIPEAVTQAAFVVIANDQTITSAAAMGNLELNPFLPLIADSLLGSLDLLSRSAGMLNRLCVQGITADEERCRQTVASSTACATSLVESIGYDEAERVAQEAITSRRSIREIVVEQAMMSPGEFDEIVSAERVTRLGSAPAGRRS